MRQWQTDTMYVKTCHWERKADRASLKETKPDVYREVPFLTGHVEFERIINIGMEARSQTLCNRTLGCGAATVERRYLFCKQKYEAAVKRCSINKKTKMHICAEREKMLK